MVKIQIFPAASLSHLLHIEITFPAAATQYTDVFFPLWRPGRYEEADFVKNVQNIRAMAEGSVLDVQKTKSNSWRVKTSSKGEWSFSYDYYAYKMDAGNCWYDEEQIYLNFISCIALVPDLMNQEHEVSIQIPESFQVACALPFHKTKFKAHSYHQLVDTPFLASDQLKELRYQVDQTQFEIWFKGDYPLSDERILQDFQQFTEGQIRSMGSFPTKRYLFIIQSLGYRHYHGVEHQDSTVLILGPNQAEYQEEYYEKLMGVASHELFHTWNVTRIRPKEMSPYRYHEEILHETGFVTEGFTTYYGDWFLKASQTYSEDMYWKELNILFNRHFQNFGRKRISLLDSSRRLWTDGYKNILPNQKVSIYVMGALNSLIIDLNIRMNSANEKSLLDVMRYLMDHYRFEQGGYSTEDVLDSLEKIGGQEIKKLTRQLIGARIDLEPLLSDALDFVGLQFTKSEPKDLFCHLTGIKTIEHEIIDIHDESPLITLLSVGDKLTHINEENFSTGLKLEEGNLIKVKRHHETFVFPFPAINRTFLHDYSIHPMSAPSAEQTRNKDLWLNIF